MGKEVIQPDREVIQPDTLLSNSTFISLCMINLIFDSYKYDIIGNFQTEKFSNFAISFLIFSEKNS